MPLRFGMGMARLRNLWARLRGSLWLLPSVFTVSAFILAELAIRIDDLIESANLRDLPGIYPGSAEGARQVLGTLAGSMVSLTTISFSVMMVVLTLASSQFGPRVLRNFLSDRLNQSVLGTFVATFVYCVMVLGRVPNPDQIGQVPRLAVSLGLVLTLVSLGMLIAFIHHVARSIQSTEIVRQAYRLALKSIDGLYPDSCDPAAEAAASEAEPPVSAPARFIRADSSGYVQAVDLDAAITFACDHDGYVRFKVQPGDFIIEDEIVAEAWSASPLPDDASTSAWRWIVLGPERTPEQDARYGLEQLAEIGTRALSPGINDPNTAVECIDYVGAALARLAKRKIPSACRRSKGQPRAWLPQPGFGEVAGAALHPIRHYGREHPRVVKRLVLMLSTLEVRAQRPSDVEWLRQQRRRLSEQLDDIADHQARHELRRLCTDAPAH
jgi:uncharacterized membrane protein